MSDGTPVEEIKIRVIGDEAPLDSALAGGEQRLQSFARFVVGVGQRIKQGIGSVMGEAGQIVTGLQNDLRPLSTELRALTETIKKYATERERGTDADRRATSDVNKLFKEYRAGTLVLGDYITKLREVARTSEEGSTRQLAALTRLRQAEKEALNQRKQEIREEEEAQRKKEEAWKQAARNQEKIRTTRNNAISSGADIAEKVGGGLTRTVTAPIAIGTAISLKTALDFDEAETQVRKFGKLSREEFASMRTELEKMSVDRVIDTDYVDLTKIAAFGEQMGIAKNDLMEFTKEVAYVGHAGDVSGEEAATGLSKIAAATGIPQKNIGKLASALASMGNMGNSSMGQILDTAKRFASEASLAKFRPDAIFAYANAVTSLGQEAEAGGSALIKIVEKVDKAVNLGGENLSIYAQLAGKTTKEFAEAYRKDAAGAIQEVVAGLDKQKAKAGEVDKILDSLGIKEVREKMAVRNLANGHKELAAELTESNRAYEAGDEHHKIAKINSESEAAALRQTKRELMLLAREYGETLLPVMRDGLTILRPVIAHLKELSGQFHRLTPEQQKSALMWTAVVAALGPVLNGLANGAKFALEFANAWKTFKAAQLAATSGSAAAEGAIAATGKAATTAAANVTTLAGALTALQALGVITIGVIATIAAYKYIGKPTADAIGEAMDAEQEKAVGSSVAEDGRRMKARYADYVNNHKAFDYEGKKRVTDDYRERKWQLPHDMKGDVDWTGAARRLYQEGDKLEKLGTLKPDAKAVAADRAANRKGRFKPHQLQYAKQIVEIGSQLGASPQQILAAIETGLVESQMSNMSGGDRDSAGIMQQRPSQDWGSYGQVTNPDYAIRAFFQGAGTNKGVLHYKNWNKSTGLLAQEVQRSGFPGRYDEREGDARALLKAIGYDLPSGEMFSTSNANIPDIVLPGKKPKKKPVIPPAITFVPPLTLSSDETFFGADAAKRLAAMPTDANNYRAKMEAIDSAGAQRKLDATKNGTFDDYQHETNLLAKRIETSGNAIRNIDAAIAQLQGMLELPKSVAEDLQGKMTAAAQRSRRARAAGDIEGVKSARTEYAQLQKEQAAAKKTYADLQSQLKNATSARGQAVSDQVGDKTKLADITNRRTTETRQKELKRIEDDLKNGVINRAEYEKQLGAAMERVGAGHPDLAMFSDAYFASAGNRANSERDLRKKTLKTQSIADGAKHKDFEAERMDLDEEVEAYRQAGNSEIQIADYKAARLRQIAHAEFEQNRSDQEQAHQAMMRMGKESLTGYRAFLVEQLQAVRNEYGETSAEAKKAALAVADVDWEIIRQQADGYRQSLDDGAMSLQAYTARLYELRTNIPATAQEYQSLSSEIRQAERAMRDAKQRTADEVGGRFGDAAVEIFRKRTTASKAFRDMATEVVDNGLRDMAKRSISKLWMNITGHTDAADKATQAAQMQNTAADKMLQAAQMQSGAATGTNAGTGTGSGTGNVSAATTVAGGLMNTIEAMGGRSGQGTTLSSVLGKTKEGIGAIGDIAKNVGQVFGKNSGVAKSAGALDKFLGGAGKWLGYAGIAYTGFELVKSLFASQERGFQAKDGFKRYADLGTGDHTGLFDTSTFSGVGGLRILDQRYRDRQARQQQVQFTDNRVFQLNINGSKLGPTELQEAVREALVSVSNETAMQNSLQGAT